MKALESQIKEFDKAIKAQMKLLPNVLISIPGIGPVYSAGIMAEIGDINRFDNQAALAKYAGLAWKQYQSGGFEAEVTRLIPSGNRFLKYYLCEAAFSLACKMRQGIQRLLPPQIQRGKQMPTQTCSRFNCP